MDAEQQQEWSKMRNEAHARLQSGFPQSNADLRVVQVLRMPSFGPWMAWELYKKRDQPLNSTLVEAIWQVENDAKKFRDPVTRLRYPQVLQPTISINFRNLPTDFLLSTIAELGDLSLPVVTGKIPLLVDGTSFEMTAGNRFATATYRWRSSPPEHWLPLHEWASGWIARACEKSSTATI